MRRAFALLLLVFGLVNAGAVAQPAEPEIWFDPAPPPLDPLFVPNAPWPNAIAKTQVMMVEPWWINQSSDAEILARLAFINLHHMKTEFNLEPIAWYPGETCGFGEGYDSITDNMNMLQRLKGLNFPVDMMYFDEPVWFGHYQGGQCQYSIPQVATRVAAMLAAVLTVYPNLEFFDVEPMNTLMQNSDWRDSVNGFWLVLAQQSGQKVRGLQVDVNWDDPGSLPELVLLNSMLHEQNMQLGIIYDGSGTDVGTTAWLNHAVMNFETVESYLGILPDQAIFMSWNSYPRQLLPETTANNMTWLIDRYALERSRLEVQFVGQGAQGRLTTLRGKPIANATVQARLPGVDFSQPLPIKTIQDVVPPTATSVLLGIRVNAECNCAGVNDLLLGTMQYQEIQGGSLSGTASVSNAPQTVNGVIVGAEWVGGTQVTRIIANAAQSFVGNLNAFPVTPGATFQFSMPASTIGGEGWDGHALMLWFDQNGAPFASETIIPDPGFRIMSTATTAADGTFTLPNLPRVGPGSAPVSVYYDGGGTYRQAVWTPLH